jgi:hypothetical protein
MAQTDALRFRHIIYYYYYYLLIIRTRERNEKFIHNFVGNLKGRDHHLGELIIDGKIILKLIVKK